MRCFLAIELPVECRRQLHGLQRSLRALDRFVRWTRPEQIHLTLKFLGEVPDGHLPAICRAVAAVAGGIPPFLLHLEGTGCFPPCGPARILWAGVGGDLPALSHCQRRCEEMLAAVGYPPENRPFHPHLTIGRVRPGPGAPQIQAAMERAAGFSGMAFAVDEIVLFQSILNPNGAEYIAIARNPLGVSRDSGTRDAE